MNLNPIECEKQKQPPTNNWRLFVQLTLLIKGGFVKNKKRMLSKEKTVNKKISLLTLIVIILLTIISACSKSPQYKIPTTSCQIAFASKRNDGDSEIHVMNADGSNEEQLTSNRWFDNSPAWSPDGARIAFHSDRDGDYEIYVMDANGGNVQQLTFNDRIDTSPSVKPPNLVPLKSRHFQD